MCQVAKYLEDQKCWNFVASDVLSRLVWKTPTLPDFKMSKILFGWLVAILSLGPDFVGISSKKEKRSFYLGGDSLMSYHLLSKSLTGSSSFSEQGPDDCCFSNDFWLRSWFSQSQVAPWTQVEEISPRHKRTKRRSLRPSRPCHLVWNCLSTSSKFKDRPGWCNKSNAGRFPKSWEKMA